MQRFRSPSRGGDGPVAAGHGLDRVALALVGLAVLVVASGAVGLPHVAPPQVRRDRPRVG